jgi:hypothetical protein
MDVGIGNLSTFVADMPQHGTTMFDLRGSTAPQIQDGEVVGADQLVIILGPSARASPVHGDLAILGWRLREVTKTLIVVPKADDMLQRPNM